jgi:hypothetical protein
LRHGAKGAKNNAIKLRKDMTHQEEAANRNCFKVRVFKSIQLLEFDQKIRHYAGAVTRDELNKRTVIDKRERFDGKRSATPSDTNQVFLVEISG